MEKEFSSISPNEFGDALQIILAAGMNALAMAESGDEDVAVCLPFEPEELSERERVALELLSDEEPDTLLRMFIMYDNLMDGVSSIRNLSCLNRVNDFLNDSIGEEDDDEDDGEDGLGFDGFAEENQRFFSDGAVQSAWVAGDISDPQVHVHLRDGDGEDLYARFELAEESDEPLEGGDAVIRTLI